MIKRVSLVWKRPELSAKRFRDLWLGEHASQARSLAGAREYVIDFVEDPKPDDPDGIATLRFDDRSAVEHAFSDKALVAELTRTREQFAARVSVFMVEEVEVFGHR